MPAPLGVPAVPQPLNIFMRGLRTPAADVVHQDVDPPERAYRGLGDTGRIGIAA
jgi:hypothetical protein